MSRARKTVNVQDIKLSVNAALASEHFMDEVKQGMCIVLENILHDANAYKGYNNLKIAFVGEYVPGQTWEMKRDENGKLTHDYSRVYY